MNSSRFIRHITPIGPHRVFFVMAALPEYGPHLQKIIDPLITGVGPVEATLHLSCALADLAARAALPDIVVAMGSAGSNRLEQGEIYQVSSVRYRDMDASPLGFEKGATPFLDLPPVLELPIRLKELPPASLSAGADIVSGTAAYEAQGADMVDMESYGYWRACQTFGIPMIGLRGISDGAADLKHYDDWASALVEIDRRLAGIIGRLEDLLPEEFASALPRREG